MGSVSNMPEEENIDFLQRKKNWILKVTEGVFREGCEDFIKNGKWSTVEDIDAWFDAEMKSYDNLREDIKDYYDRKIYS